MSPHQSVITSLHAANSNPAVFEDPDRFDIIRKHVPHVAFGGGNHICIGAPLARVEARHALVKLFERFPDRHLAGDEPTLARLGIACERIRPRPWKNARSTEG